MQRWALWPCKEIIVNPIKMKVTHFVVEDSIFPDENTRLVPIERVASATAELIRLDVAVMS